MKIQKEKIIWVVVGVIIVLLCLNYYAEVKKSKELVGFEVHYYRNGVEITKNSVWLNKFFSVINPVGQNNYNYYDSIAFGLRGTNNGNINLSNLTLVDASPQVFKDALNFSQKVNLDLGNSSILWTSLVMNTSQFESMAQPVNFTFTVTVNDPITGTPIYANATLQLRITPDLFNYVSGQVDNGNPAIKIPNAPVTISCNGRKIDTTSLSDGTYSVQFIRALCPVGKTVTVNSSIGGFSGTQTGVMTDYGYTNMALIYVSVEGYCVPSSLNLPTVEDFSITSSTQSSSQAALFKFNTGTLPVGAQITTATFFFKPINAGGTARTIYIMGVNSQTLKETSADPELRYLQIYNRSVINYPGNTLNPPPADVTNIVLTSLINKGFKNITLLMDSPERDGFYNTNTTHILDLDWIIDTDTLVGTGDPIVSYGGTDIAANEYATVSYRPKLTINYAQC